VLRGEAGIGKSTLLAYAEERAAGMTILHARGIESEAELAFSGLLEIARPILNVLPAIPKPQAAALCGALALTPAAPGDRFTIGAATLSLLAAAAEQAPLVLLVDDVQWLDAPSCDALLFAARRLEADRVALALTVRDGDGREVETSGLEELTLSGLSDEDASWLLAHHLGESVSPRVAEAIQTAAAGNPLALLELPRALSRDQLAGAEPLEEPLRAGERLEHAFARRASELPPASQRALLVAAASTTESLRPILDALSRVEAAEPDLNAAEHAGLVQLEPGRLRFRHPLVRSAIYHAAAPGEQRAAHLALADGFKEEGEGERHAWHLAAAALTPDEAIAAELERVAATARERSGYAAAAAAYERSARLTPEEGTRAVRLFAAAEAAWEAGYARQASRLLDEALAGCSDGRARADIQHLRGRILLRGGSLPDARRLLIEEAEAVVDIDPQKAAFMLAEAAEASVYFGDFSDAAEVSARAAALATEGFAAAYADGVRGAALVNTSRGDEGRALLQRLVDTVESDEQLRSNPFMVSMALNGPGWRDELPSAIAAAERAVDLIRAQSAVGDLGYPLEYLACFQIAAGRWPEGHATALDAVRVTRETGQTSDVILSLWALATVIAGRGQIEAALAAADEGARLAGERGSLTEWPAFALGFIYLSTGDWSAAVQALEPVVRLEMTHAQQCPVMAPFDLVEAYVRTGERERAADALRQIEGGYASRPWEMAGISRSHGLLDDEPACFEALRDASAAFEGLTMPFERARADLYLGERLRRAGKPKEAREPLHAALATFDELAAEPWAERTRKELRATGETVRRRDPAARESLTPQELQIALVVARGRTNREAGAELFLSPKTIEAHLSRVYRKLGITSRTQLVRLFTEQRAGETGQPEPQAAVADR
jgi:DNA-binding CsgD family transcriptional regulator